MCQALILGCLIRMEAILPKCRHLRKCLVRILKVLSNGG
jgi:hypothetical protein